MKIAIIGATGNIGGAILAEALAHTDNQITAISRHASSLPPHPRLTGVPCDIYDIDALAKVLQGHDAVIHAFHPGNQDPQAYEKSLAGHKAIVAATKKAGVPRLLGVGGAASLQTKEGVEYIDSSMWNKEFDPYKPAILGTRALYYVLKDEKELDWVFLAPSAWLRPGSRTGKFRYGKNEILFDQNGESRISIEDYAMAMIAELQHPQHHRERFTVGY